ncbi:ribose 5-phosphate isomerase A [Mucilaginibacter sp. BJC16-A38]|uniref:ribose 5-phosphate isomerase A n=1 Tax=Mucilaginibacter phenanthrenivorans TaxID=1234842 RepID=UPI0021576F05|nr:ribose 5-phosphate isomerase A [Mucilaginibacter phenanthrenivorans]MCR8556588.1 ribose 5-phosphate isomerase A [Mucilaginibacter phenanthrenivorans]
MKWNSSLLDHLQWSDTIINREAKEKVAQQIAEKINNGDVIGAGSGSTVYMALYAIAKRIKEEGLAIQMIPASLEIGMTCENLGIPVTSLLTDKPIWCFDGADEVDPDNSLIKGRGGALFKEKLLICSGSKTYILVDESKLVKKLGTNFPVPVEIFPGSLTYVESALRKLNVTDIALRMAKGKDGPIITENGNFLLDVRFEDIRPDYEQRIKSITGVIDSGLFIGYNVEILVAK